MKTLMMLAAFSVCDIDHYVAFNNQQPEIVSSAAQQGIVGFSKTFRWKDLEPTDNNYNWTEVDKFMIAAEKNNLQYFIFPHWRGFKGWDPVPDFIPVAIQKSGSTQALIWQDEVVKQLKELYKAIGLRYGDNPNFGGILLQETALGLGAWDKGVEGNLLDSLGYDVDLFSDKYIELASFAAGFMPNKKIFIFPTWWATDYWGETRDNSYTTPGNLHYVRKVIQYFEGTPNVYIGGPDVLPNNGSLNKLVYPAYKEGYDIKPSFQAQFASFTTGFTVEEITKFNSTELNSVNMFWTWVKNPDPDQSIDDVFNMLKENQCVANGCH